MPRISCRNNPECYIDCPGSGYAYYKPPYGPCETGCDEAASMSALLLMIQEAASPKVFSGTVVGVRAATLSRFATELVDVISDADFRDVQQLQNAAILTPDRRFNADWVEQEPKDIVRIIADSTRGNESGNLKAIA